MTNVRFTPGRSLRPALDGVTLAVVEGETLLVRGPSGGGKSTLLRVIGGLVPSFHGGRFSGRVTVFGRETRNGPVALAGLAGTLFQDPEAQAVRAVVARDVAFGLENLGVAAAQIPGRVIEALELAGAVHLHDRTIASLSGGERQRVAIAGVLALRPRLLLLDEPTSQLDAAGASQLADVIGDLRAGGTTIVVAEHRTDRVAHLADRVVTIDAGRLQPDTTAPPERAPAPRIAGGAAVLSVQSVCAGYGGVPVLEDCSLDLMAGSVVALHGPNGAGKSTLGRVIAGLHRPDAGTVLHRERNVTDVPAERRHPQIAFLTQDAGRWLVRERVADEVAFGMPVATDGAGEARVRDMLDSFDLADLAGRHPLDLSVGERERVALAATLAPGPEVLILDEPSRGMDPARTAALIRTLRRHAAGGGAALVITHDAELASLAADRHVRLEHGRIAEMVPVAG